MSTRQRRRNRAGDPVWMSGIITGNWDPHQSQSCSGGITKANVEYTLNSRYSSCGCIRVVADSDSKVSPYGVCEQSTCNQNWFDHFWIRLLFFNCFYIPYSFSKIIATYMSYMRWNSVEFRKDSAQEHKIWKIDIQIPWEIQSNTIISLPYSTSEWPIGISACNYVCYVE